MDSDKDRGPNGNSNDAAVLIFGTKQELKVV